MRKGLILYGIFFISILTLSLFQVKYKVVELEDRIKVVNKDIFKIEESLHVLKAEWTYRTSPLRINQLAEKHLKMTTFNFQQIETQDDELPLESPLLFEASYKSGGPN